MLSHVLSSASRIVFLLMTIALIVGLFVGKIDPKDFIVLASMVFTFYFTKPNAPPDAGKNQ